MLVIISLLALGACGKSELARLESGAVSAAAFQNARAGQASMLMQAAYPVVQDSALQQYILSIKNELLAQTRLAGNIGDIFALDTSEVFAYSFENGDIYLSLGIIFVAENEAQLASIIAHELGHLYLQHHRRSREQGSIINLEEAPDTASDDGTTRGMVSAFRDIVSYGRNRAQEAEADRFMMQILARSKYDLVSAGYMFEHLAQLELAYADSGDRLVTTKLFDTHPNYLARLRAIEKFLGSSQPQHRGRNLFQQRYQEMIKPHLQAWRSRIGDPA